MTYEDLSKQLNTSVQTIQNLVQILATAFADMEGGGGGGASEYVAEETEIGSFLGKALYRQVISLANISLSSGQEAEVAALATGLKPRKIIACGNEGGIWYQMPEYSLRLSYVAETGKLNVKASGSGWPFTEGYIIFEYEKT